MEKLQQSEEGDVFIFILPITMFLVSVVAILTLIVGAVWVACKYGIDP